MAIDIWVYFNDVPGGGTEQRIQTLAKEHGGQWWGEGTTLATMERDNSFDFPDSNAADRFLEAVGPLLHRFTRKGG